MCAAGVGASTIAARRTQTGDELGVERPRRREAASVVGAAVGVDAGVGAVRAGLSHATTASVSSSVHVSERRASVAPTRQRAWRSWRGARSRVTVGGEQPGPRSSAARGARRPPPRLRVADRRDGRRRARRTWRSRGARPRWRCVRRRPCSPGTPELVAAPDAQRRRAGLPCLRRRRVLGGPHLVHRPREREELDRGHEPQSQPGPIVGVRDGAASSMASTSVSAASKTSSRAHSRRARSATAGATSLRGRLARKSAKRSPNQRSEGCGTAYQRDTHGASVAESTPPPTSAGDARDNPRAVRRRDARSTSARRSSTRASESRVPRPSITASSSRMQRRAVVGRARAERSEKARLELTQTRHMLPAPRPRSRAPAPPRRRAPSKSGMCSSHSTSVDTRPQCAQGEHDRDPRPVGTNRRIVGIEQMRALVGVPGEVKLSDTLGRDARDVGGGVEAVVEGAHVDVVDVEQDAAVGARRPAPRETPTPASPMCVNVR